MDRRKRALQITAVAAAFALAVGFAIQGYSRTAQAQRQSEQSALRAYYELTAAVAQMDADLQKLQYVTTPVLMQALCADLYGRAMTAQMALGELPDSHILLEQTCAFLARTGDYANALVKTCALQGCRQEDAQQLGQLADASAALSAALLSLEEELADGSVDMAQLLDAERALAQSTGDGQAGVGGSSFQTIEADFPETPSLIYDGPFSEHLSRRTPLALEGLEELSQEQAAQRAAAFLGCTVQDLTPTGQGEGALPTWAFRAGDAYVELTRQGGQALNLFNQRPVDQAAISAVQAVATARTFLQERGFACMQESYHIRQDNVLTIHFAPLQGEVLCYPDLVKVSVALDNGEIVGFEGHGWVMNHTLRALTDPQVSQEQAQAVVSSQLEVLSHRLALIPTAGELEVLCHEFTCRTGEDSHVLVYVNAATGQEERILLLLEDESGTLVW
ncbi:MAG: germination protein YpeB [Oscillospiraceae bacterium]|nr:germination protein YpeB [Oscillospiraceae bacterium]